MGTNKAYYVWLCGLVGTTRRDEEYWCLTSQMFEKPFYWHIDNDDNRAFDGQNLRTLFSEDVGIPYCIDDYSIDTSMFEMIVGLAYRLDEIMIGQEGLNASISDWFWLLMDNCGLSEFTDSDYDEIFVDSILEKIINRTYHRDGRGGLFPLKHTQKDQRKVEIWYQMSEYLVENFGF